MLLTVHGLQWGLKELAGTWRRRQEDRRNVENNPFFHLLPSNVNIPHSSCYAAVAASPPRLAAPTPSRQPCATPMATAPLLNGRQTVFFSTSLLPADGKFRLLPPFFLLKHAKVVVRKAGAKPETVVAAVRMERGDLRVVLRGGGNGAKGKAALAAVAAVVERVATRERRTVMVHLLPAGMGAEELKDEGERWAPGKVVEAQVMAMREGRTVKTGVVVLQGEEEAVRLAQEQHVQLHFRGWVRLERAKVRKSGRTC